MKKMTKTTSLLLALMLSVSCVIGCTNENAPTPDNAAKPNDTSQATHDPTEELRQQIAELEQELSAVQSDFSKLSEDNEALQAENEILKNTNETLSSNNAQLTSDNKKLADDYNVLESSYAVLSAEHNDLKENSISTEEYQTLQSGLQKTTTDLNNLQFYCGTLETQNNTLTAERDSLKQQISQLQGSQISTEKYNELQSSYNELKTSYGGIVSDYNVLYQLYMSNYNPSGSQSSVLDKKYVVLLEKMLIVKSCIETFNYYDYNISTVLYEYIIDPEEGSWNKGLKRLKDMKNEVYSERWFGDTSDIRSWVSLNSFDYSIMEASDLRNMESDLIDAFDELQYALDYLYKYLDDQSMSDYYERQFQNKLESARNEISNVDAYCQAFITSCLRTINSHAKEVD